jgi:hypothetical protein
MKLHSLLRVACNLILAGVLLLAAGCMRAEATAPVASAGAVSGSAGAGAKAVRTRADAEIAGKNSLQAPGFEWIGSPRLALAEEMSYAEAVKKIGVGDGQYDVWRPETRVWLVIFQGSWLLTPMGPSQPPPAPIRYEGCLMTVLAAGDASRIAAGDAVCPAH